MKTNHRPNLFLVGAMKSGSSALTFHLHAHPQIFMTMRPKEPSYFVAREQLKEVYPQMERLGLWKGEECYLALFKGADNARVVGDASQNYARLNRVTGVAERIAAFNRDARILYIMRDPVERTISHYWYMVLNFGERRDISEAIKRDRDYLDTSYYAMQLKPYIELFGRENVKAITSEAMRSSLIPTMQGVYEWLGVDRTFEPPNKSFEVNITPEQVSQVRGLGLLHQVKHSKLWSAIGPSVPRPIRALGNRLSVKTVKRKNVQVDKVMEFLRPIQQNQTSELADLLGRGFTEWTTLYGTNNLKLRARP